jgi:energy-coupling factor transport system ATP-binding protein
VITVENLTYRYHGQDDDALRGLSLHAPRGRLVLISGPTGSGKSTLAQALCGAVPHLLHGTLAGRVLIDGHEVAAASVRSLARSVGMMLQNVEWQTFTDAVDDEIAFGLENLAVPPAEMPARIAAALAAELVSLLRAIADRGRTVVVLEHRHDLLRSHIDIELRLRDGRLDDSPIAPSNAPPPQPPPHRPGAVMLEYRDVAFAWPRRASSVFRDVSFEVRASESVVLLGDNGTGKTTLLKLALGLLRPSAGRVRTAGLDATRARTRRLADAAALVLQNPDHQLHLPTVAEEIGWAAIDLDDAARRMADLALDGLEPRHPQSLSVGQKRRVTIAAALARRPCVLLLDEPSVGQDDASLDRVLRALTAFVADGGALLTATHDPRVVHALAHRTALLEHGRLRIADPNPTAAHQPHTDRHVPTTLTPIEAPRC